MSRILFVIWSHTWVQMPPTPVLFMALQCFNPATAILKTHKHTKNSVLETQYKRNMHVRTHFLYHCRTEPLSTDTATMSDHFSASLPFCLSAPIIPNLLLQIWEPSIKNISATAGGIYGGACLPCYGGIFLPLQLCSSSSGDRGDRPIAQVRAMASLHSWAASGITLTRGTHLFLITHIRESKVL